MTTISSPNSRTSYENVTGCRSCLFGLFYLVEFLFISFFCFVLACLGLHCTQSIGLFSHLDSKTWSYLGLNMYETTCMVSYLFRDTSRYINSLLFIQIDIVHNTRYTICIYILGIKNGCKPFKQRTVRQITFYHGMSCVKDLNCATIANKLCRPSWKYIDD